MNEKISAAILAGGKGVRLSPHKGLLKVGSKAIIVRQIEELGKIFGDIFIVTNSPEVYSDLGAKLVADTVLDKGPLGGVYSLLKETKAQYNFIIACDMPCLNITLIKYMSENLGAYDVIVPEFSRRLEPLFAFYSKNCVCVIEKQLRKNNLRLQEIFPLVKTRIITEAEVARFDTCGESFTNINTPEDYNSFH